MELNLEEALEAPVNLSHRLEVPTGRLERPELLSLEPAADLPPKPVPQALLEERAWELLRRRDFTRPP